MHEGPFFFGKVPPQDVRVFCPRAGCEFDERMDTVDASIAVEVPCPKCFHLGVTALAIGSPA